MNKITHPELITSRSWRLLSGSTILLIILLVLFSGCNKRPGGNVTASASLPSIDPDYTGITIPPDIAPLNFRIADKGKSFYVTISSETGGEIVITSSDGKILIPERKWKKMLTQNQGNDLRISVSVRNARGTWTKYSDVVNRISAESIDPFIYYRVLYPGYESWNELSIDYRETGSFSSGSFIRNKVADDNCINCHSFNNGKSDDFLFHMRGSMGGTYFYSGGIFKKVNLKTQEMRNAAVYPRWHPSGKFVAFSSNKIIQQFHASDNKKIEVSDLESSLLLYDVARNEIMDIPLSGRENFMDTYPEWSPDGKFLYFCRATALGKEYDYRQIRYNLYRVPFEIESRTFGEAELVFDAAGTGKSISFPRISPDGRFIVGTVADYGCFPIWHKEADLWLIDSQSKKSARMALNSDWSDSYHSWSSNGRWIIFSSKRLDGLTARPFISFIDREGNAGKPFVLPQKDPEFYQHFLKSFNIPEFSNTRIKTSPGKIRRMAEQEAIQAKWYKR